MNILFWRAENSYLPKDKVVDEEKLHHKSLKKKYSPGHNSSYKRITGF